MSAKVSLKNQLKNYSKIATQAKINQNTRTLFYIKDGLCIVVSFMQQK